MFAFAEQYTVNRTDIAQNEMDLELKKNLSFGASSVLEAVYASPRHMEQNVSINTVVSMTFNEDIQQGPVFDQISIESQNERVRSEIEINGDRLLIQPENSLDYSVTYSVYVPVNSIKGLSGSNLLENQIVTFKTEDAKQFNAPQQAQKNRISAGYSHTATLLGDGTVWGWGKNTHGQLGNGVNTDSTSPVTAKGVGGAGILSDIVSISAGGSHTAALKSDGTVVSWGYNYSGQLGDGGSPFSKSTPVRVKDSTGTGYLSEVTSISAGYNFTVALKADGTVWSWGFNKNGQLGDGTNEDRNLPVQVKSPDGIGVLTDVVSVIAGNNTVAAIKKDGTLWTWGYNTNGQLGDGTLVSRNLPVQVKGPGGTDYLTDIASVAVGGFHMAALKTDGTLWSWGFNGDGQLGDGTKISRSWPAQVKGPDGTGFSGATAVALGYRFSLVLKSDGTLWSWGDNQLGQLGDGTTTGRNVPSAVSGIGMGVEEIAAGGEHAAILKSDGTILAWGANGFGQLGDGSTANSYLPTPVNWVHLRVLDSRPQPDAIIVPGQQTIEITFDQPISAGPQYGLIVVTANQDSIETDAEIDGSKLKLTPKRMLQPQSAYQVTLPTGALQSAAGNIVNQTYHYSFYTGVAPQQAQKNRISAGYSYTATLLGDGTVWGWGKNTHGQLGNGVNTDSTSPVTAKGVGGAGILSDIVSISAGGSHTAALKSDGTVVSWGYNYSGQLGDGGSPFSKSTPVRVKDSTGTGYLSEVTSISAGYNFTVALKADGTVWSWGFNKNGQLGDGTNEDRNLPVQVKSPDGIGVLTDVVSVIAGNNTVAAIKKDGTLWTWGYNTNGQLGDGTLVSRNLPVQVKGPGGTDYLTDIASVAVGGFHMAALKTDGTLWSWGFNGDGQLGDGTKISRSWPAQVKGPDGTGFSGATAVALGYRFSLVLKSDGTLWSWGDNQLGQLGDGTTTGRNVPSAVSGIGMGVEEIAAGGEHAAILKSDGTILAWGANLYGDGIATIDLVAPTSPANLLSQMVTEFTVSLTWEASQDNLGIKEYQIFDNETMIATTHDTTISIMLDPNKLHRIRVRSVDSAGNESMFSNTITLIFDKQAPSAPKKLFINRRNNGVIQLAWQASQDNGEVTGYEIYNRSTLIGTVAGNEIVFPFTPAPNTIYVFSIKAVDAAQNLSESSNPVIFAANGKLTYQYDAASRLTAIIDTVSGKPIQIFQYDHNGNLVKSLLSP